MTNLKSIPIIISELERLFPNARCELNFSTDFQLMVAVILSAQTTDKQVNKITSSFFKQMENEDDAINLGVEKITGIIKSIGFYHNKAKFIVGSAEVLKNKYNGVIPNSLKELQTFPGVGIKTAKVILLELYGGPYLAVDTHVHRVTNRIGLVNTKSAEETDKKADKIFNNKDKARLHHLLIHFGRYHCMARKPKCGVCNLSNHCKYFKTKK